MLCREKISNQKKGTAVIAACGEQLASKLSKQHST